MAFEAKAPWLNNYGDVRFHLDYFDGSMWEAVRNIAHKYPDYIAFDFMGKTTTYATFEKEVYECAKALKAIGVKPKDRVTVCMPNCPQTVIIFYAINLVGAVSNMIHPLSSENEIEFFINHSKSVCAITVDMFYSKFAAIRDSLVTLKTLIITSIKDALSAPMKLGYALTQGRKIDKLPNDAPVLWWNDFLKKGRKYVGEYMATVNREDVAVILYSGGTTGTTKGILLTNLNFNALKAQIIETNPMFAPGDKMLAVMPMFHGFGLGVTIHSMLANGGRCILVPRFTPETYARDIVKHRCNFIAGVPTLYEALLRQPKMDGADLSCLKGVFSGGDSLSVALKKKFDKFLKDHNASIVIREGYGTTECVTASCLTPAHLYKEGSIGQPFPDTYYKIVDVGTNIEIPYGKEGEICISGPTVMKGYLDQPEETANTLRLHGDGRIWLHTGDLGSMDDEGFIYFKQRIKRMIVTSGYNVYPSQIENILDNYEAIQMSCVIGVPDEYKMQRVKAFVMLKPGYEPTEETKQAIIAYCKKNIAKYAMPYDIEFRDSLPKTLVGKVAYRKLEEEELAKMAAQKKTEPQLETV
ncbi:MAG TPA: AMP-binding protein [Candidatus Faeciplasma pullistercoris]|uniref:AMP-binding protein n=1 Tax=Candidatus Faeciplasma pullistercoris TaxID=2840800 RepID=A0A9D1GT03_9FIRM|nr:AMP-binding protein [Candidatus Faeciplasma pullistercoris]